MPTKILRYSCSTGLGLYLKALNLIYFFHNCWTNINIENFFNTVVISPLNPMSYANLLTNASDPKEFEKTKPYHLHMTVDTGQHKLLRQNSSLTSHSTTI